MIPINIHEDQSPRYSIRKGKIIIIIPRVIEYIPITLANLFLSPLYCFSSYPAINFNFFFLQISQPTRMNNKPVIIQITIAVEKSVFKDIFHLRNKWTFLE